MKACMEQPEYAGKTFGVISLLGAEQARYIEKLITQDDGISAKDMEERGILCGDSANFQGDERDIIFLSMVDSPSTPTDQLRLQGFGAQDSTRKRYNVAASRAKDQLWVIHSLDYNVNLKAGDIRKGLIEYALNPNNVAVQKDAVTALADSEFEVQVAMKLQSRGYHIVQQWEVGAYRIDMVAVFGDKKIAIECDGDRYHSSHSQVRNDMERQTILERIGWTFIRIRGSEYFRNPDKTMERVVIELENLGIHPEHIEATPPETDRGTELLNRVKHRATMILRSESVDGNISKDNVHENPDDANIGLSVENVEMEQKECHNNDRLSLSENITTNSKESFGDSETENGEMVKESFQANLFPEFQGKLSKN